LSRKDAAAWFGDPVKPTPTFASDYFKIVKQPMDIGTIKHNLNKGKYDDPLDFEQVRNTCALALAL
jgi:hypothetical protein